MTTIKKEVLGEQVEYFATHYFNFHLMDYQTVNWSLILMTIIFLLSVFTFFMVSIKKSGKILHDQFIRGTWQHAGKTPDGHAWYFNYHFTEKDYHIEAYPPFQAKGKYKIVKEIESLIVLKVFNITGDGETQPHFLNIGVDKKRQQLTINDRVYKRIQQ